MRLPRVIFVITSICSIVPLPAQAQNRGRHNNFGSSLFGGIISDGLRGGASLIGGLFTGHSRGGGSYGSERRGSNNQFRGGFPQSGYQGRGLDTIPDTIHACSRRVSPFTGRASRVFTAHPRLTRLATQRATDPLLTISITLGPTPTRRNIRRRPTTTTLRSPDTRLSIINPAMIHPAIRLHRGANLTRACPTFT